MNDFDYEVMQKKRIAHGAAHMKRGSKSKKCSLPSDNMTPAQWKRRNGPVSTYSLNQPMSWEQFKKLPLDIQQAYIDALQSRFGVSAARISQDLFGLSHAALRLHLSKRGIKYAADLMGKKLDPEAEDLWHNWLSPVAPQCAEDYDAETEERMDDEPIDEGPMEDPDVTEVVEGFKKWSEELPRELMVERAKEAIKPDILSLDKLSATFSGDFDAEAFLRWVTRLPMPEGKVCIKVEVMAL